jgi:hypothetical protein
LPDNIFIFSYERETKINKEIHIGDATTRDRTDRQNNNSNNNNHNESEDIQDFEKKTITYDIDSIEEINSNRDISPDEFESLLKDLEDVFISVFKEKTDRELRAYIYNLWNLEELLKEGIVELKDIHKGYEKNLSNILKIYMLFLRYKMVGKNSAEAIWNQNVFNRALKSVYYMNNILVSEYHIRKNVEDENFLNQEDSLNLNRFTPQDLSKNKPYQDLLIFLLNKAYQKGYRLYRESCYKQIYHNGYPTHAWKYVMPILAFVYEAVSRETNYEMWLNLTDAKDNAKTAATYLLNAKDKELPTLEPDRHLFAFSDGIYDAKTTDFYKYDTHPLPSNRVAVKFFDQPFDADLLYSYRDWWDIPTPDLQNIFIDQGLPDEVCRIVYAFMGRCLYDVNEMDCWEVLMFIKGIAGSGKSTIGKILKDFYPTADVFILSSNIEKKFGLSPIYDKLLFLCFEVKSNWGLDQGDFQCMISGEEVPVAIKHKTAISTLWKVPGMLMGNEVAGSWLDASGSMTRRILLLEFLKKVKVVDTNLGKKIKERIAATIHKCNMAYHQLLHDCGSATIWDKLPEYFKQTRKKLAATINPLEDFLTGDALRIEPDDPNCCIPLEEFQVMYMNFIKQRSYGKVRFNQDHYGTVFETYGIYIKTVPEKTFGDTTKRNVKWIFGIGLKEDDGMIDNVS